jgi:hypothetical protein
MRVSKIYRRRAGLLLVVCVLGGTACDRSPERPAPPPAPSVWEQTLAAVDDNGNVSLANAVMAYSIAIQPLPGVNVPAAARNETIPSGTVAVRWLLRHWDALTPQQQQAVLGAPSADPPRRLRGSDTGSLNRPAVAALARAPSTGPSASAPADPDLTCVPVDAGAVQSYRAWGDGIVAEVGKRLGHGLGPGFRITYAANTREAQGAVMYSAPCRGGKDIVAAKSGPIDGCTVHINPNARQRPSVDQRTFLIHEIMHCVLWDEFDSAYHLMPN